MNYEEADFQVLYIAVTLNVVIYFHPYVLYFRNIMELFSCFSDFIGVLTCGQDNETLHFVFEDGTDIQSKPQHLCVKFEIFIKLHFIWSKPQHVRSFRVPIC